MSNRFNPEPGTDYGKCKTCGIGIPTDTQASEHMTATLNAALAEGGSRGHTISVQNQTREQRIESAVAQEVEDAIDACMSELDDMVSRGHVTEAEIQKALLFHSDFADAWDEYIKETR